MKKEKIINKLDEGDINWTFKRSLAFTDHHHSLFRCDEYGLQMEQISNISPTTGDFLKPKTYYYIDGHEKPFKTIESLCDAWNELNDFDDPNSEIVWVKKIVPTVKIKS